LTNVSPSGKELTVHFAKGMPMDAVIRSASGRLEVPLKIFTLSLLVRDQMKKPTGWWIFQSNLC
jgi:hypothetical protein